MNAFIVCFFHPSSRDAGCPSLVGALRESHGRVWQRAGDAWLVKTDQSAEDYVRLYCHRGEPGDEIVVIDIMGASIAAVRYDQTTSSWLSATHRAG